MVGLVDNKADMGVKIREVDTKQWTEENYMVSPINACPRMQSLPELGMRWPIPTAETRAKELPLPKALASQGQLCPR